MIGIRRAIAKIAACRCSAKYHPENEIMYPDAGHTSDCLRYVKGGSLSELQSHTLVWIIGDVYGKRTFDIAKAVQRIWDAEDAHKGAISKDFCASNDQKHDWKREKGRAGKSCNYCGFWSPN